MKKALSPMIAEVLMIVLVIGIGIAFVSWSDYFSKSSKEKTDERYSSTVSCANALAQLDVVFIKKTSSDIKILISNKGSIIYNIDSIEVYNQRGEVCKDTTSYSLTLGETKWIQFKCNDGFIQTCSDFRSLFISSPCTDKSISFAKKLKDTGTSCKYEIY